LIEHKDSYLETWKVLKTFCSTPVSISNPNKLTDKEKTAVKEKFKKFNSLFENLIAINR